MQSGDHQPGLVGMLIPDAELGQPALTGEVSDLLSQEGLEPRQLGLATAARCHVYQLELRRCDWMIIDTSTPAGSGGCSPSCMAISSPHYASGSSKQ